MDWFRALVLLLPWLVVLPQSKTGSRITVEQQRACSGLTAEQCCQQMVIYNSYRATTEQLPKRAAQAVGLRCQDKVRLGNKTSCTNVALARGMSMKVGKGLCETRNLRQKCDASQFCAQCTAELYKLDYPEPYWICSAATYQDENARTSLSPIVIELSEPLSRPSADGTTIIVKKRQVLH